MAFKGSEPPTYLTWGESDTGKATMPMIWAAVETVIALYSMLKALEMAKRQEQIARKYWQIARDWRDWYKDNYIDIENDEVAEARALPIHQPHYNTAVGRARVTARLLAKGRLEQAIRCTHQYSTGLRGAKLLDEANAQAYAIAAVEGMGFRNERKHTDVMNDRRWKRREQTLNHGRDLMAKNVVFGEIAGNIFNDLADQWADGASSAATAAGYFWNQRDVQMPNEWHYAGLTRQQPREFVGPPKPTIQQYLDSTPTRGSAIVPQPVITGPEIWV